MRALVLGPYADAAARVDESRLPNMWTSPFHLVRSLNGRPSRPMAQHWSKCARSLLSWPPQTMTAIRKSNSWAGSAKVRHSPFARPFLLSRLLQASMLTLLSSLLLFFLFDTPKPNTEFSVPLICLTNRVACVGELMRSADNAITPRSEESTVAPLVHLHRSLSLKSKFLDCPCFSFCQPQSR